MTNDLINASFEFVMAVTIFYSCLTLYRDKKVRGLSVWMVAFPTAWGFWNIYYYPSLGQTLSFIGGLFIVAANCLYLSLIFKYRKN